MNKPLPDLSKVKLPIRFMLSQKRIDFRSARDDENWKVLIGLLDLEITGFSTAEETLASIRSTIMTREHQLRSITITDLSSGSCGPVTASDGKVLWTAESRMFTVSADPTEAFRALIYRSSLDRRRRAVVESAKVWRSMPMPPSTGPDSAWHIAQNTLETAVDDLVSWEESPST